MGLFRGTVVGLFLGTVVGRFRGTVVGLFRGTVVGPLRGTAGRFLFFDLFIGRFIGLPPTKDLKHVWRPLQAEKCLNNGTYERALV